MQTLILSLVFAISVFAKGTAVLTSEYFFHHGKERTQIFRDGKEWYCVTEVSRHYPIPGRPKSLDLMPSRKSLDDTCKEKLSVANYENRTLTWSGCKDTAKAFLEKLNQECGRN